MASLATMEHRFDTLPGGQEAHFSRLWDKLGSLTAMVPDRASSTEGTDSPWPSEKLRQLFRDRCHPLVPLPTLQV